MDDATNSIPLIRRQRTVFFIAGFLYFLLSCVFMYPQMTILMRGFAESPVGQTSDFNLFMWNAWWTKTALVDLKSNPYMTSYLFYPNKVSLALHELSLLNNILTIPFQLIFDRPGGIILGYNVALFLNFLLAGIAMFALLQYLTRSATVAFFGGAAFAFCPYRSMHIAHIDMLSMGWIPLYVLFLLKTVQEPKFRNPILGALVLGAASLTCTTYAYFIILISGLYLVYAGIFEKKALMSRRTLFRLLVLAALGSLILLPRLIAILHSGAMQKQPENTLEIFSANLAGYVIPADKHVLYRFLYSLLPDISYYFSGVPGHATFLTYTLIVLALVCLAKLPAKMWGFWLLAFFIFAVLSLGPHLHAGEWQTQIPLPYGVLYAWMPFFGIMRTPYRFVVLAEMAIIIIASFGLLHILGKIKARELRVRSRRIQADAAAAGITFLLLLELWNIPFHERIPAVPDIYLGIAKEEGEFAVLDLPADSYRALTTAMYYQTLHEKPIPIGLLSRSNPALRSFTGQLIPASPHPMRLSESEAKRLKRLKIKYVIYHAWQGGMDRIVGVLRLF